MNNLRSFFTLSLTALLFLGTHFGFAANDNPSSADTTANICISQEKAATALAYLNTQGGALEIAAEILSQISALKISSIDFTKTSADIERYETFFTQLIDFLKSLQDEKFLGTPLFRNIPGADFPEALASTPDLAQAIHEVTEAKNLLAVTLAMVTASNDSVIVLRSQNDIEAKRLEAALQNIQS